MGLEAFGAFSLATAVYFLLIELVRPLALEPLIVRHSTNRPGQEAAAASWAVLLSAQIGLASGLIVAAIGAAIGGDAGPPMLVMGALLPGLFVQDACRYIFFSEGRMRAAAFIDGVWLVVEVAILGALLTAHAITPATAIAAWGVGGLISAVLGVRWANVRLSLRGSWTWLRMHRDLTVRYVVEVFVEAGAFQVTLLVVGVVGGLSALGALNGARVLLGPLSMVFVAVVTFTVSEGSRMRTSDIAGADRLVRAAGIALPVLALLWTASLVVLPDAFGRFFLGATFEVAQAAILGLGVYWGTKGSINVVRGGLRMAGLANVSLNTMILLSPLGVLGGVAGAVLSGAEGAAWGLGISNILAAAVWWHRLRRHRGGSGVR
ncbi:hypothetical protein [Blastococcus sp. SYSU DS0539]